MVDTIGVQPNPVLVYCNDEESGSFYNDRGTITLALSSWSSCIDTVMHEYGHHMQRQFGSNSLLLAGGTHYYTQPSSRFVAWSEGWAEVFPAIVQQRTPLNRRPKFSMDSNYNYADSKYKSYDLEDGKHHKTWVDSNYAGQAKKIECVIAELLWDIYDPGESVTGEYDGLCLGARDWFSVTTKDGPKTIDGFYEDIIDTYPSLKTTIDRMFQYRDLL